MYYVRTYYIYIYIYIYICMYIYNIIYIIYMVIIKHSFPIVVAHTTRYGLLLMHSFNKLPFPNLQFYNFSFIIIL